MKSTIINLFAGPSAGKSSISAGLTHNLKRKHITCDNPYEFTKILAWDKNVEAVKDQLYILANQHRSMVQSFGKVEYIIIDSPILLSLVYKDFYGDSYPSNLYGELFDKLVLELHNSYDTVNIFLKRSQVTHHNNEERFQTADESLILDDRIKKILKTYDVDFFEVDVDDNTVSNICNKILKIK